MACGPQPEKTLAYHAAKMMKSEILLLMAEILHQLIGSFSYYLWGFIHPRWCRISAINRMKYFVLKKTAVSARRPFIKHRI